jgi:hypothetical protein
VAFGQVLLRGDRSRYLFKRTVETDQRHQARRTL